jgi:hypothetical protein
MNRQLLEQRDSAWMYWEMELKPGPAVYGGKCPIRGYSLEKHIQTQQTEGFIRAVFCRKVLRNIFIPCCPETGVVGIDFDSHEAAEEAMKKLPHTELRTITPRGIHLLYPAPEGLDIKSWTGVTIAGITADVRWGVATLNAAPGRHPSGKHYQREGSWSLERSQEFDPDLLERPACKCPSRPPASPETTTCKRREHLIRRAEGYGTRIVCIEGKKAHNTLFRYVCWMVDELNLTRDEIRRVLHGWNHRNCFHEDGATPYPWSPAEIEHKLDSVEKR